RPRCYTLVPYTTLFRSREIPDDGGDRHDRHGFLRAELPDQHRHQHDRGAGADDAADRAGNQPDREDEDELQIQPSSGGREARLRSEEHTSELQSLAYLV